MFENKIQLIQIVLCDFIVSVEYLICCDDVLILLVLMEKIIGWEVMMWGVFIIGFGIYKYQIVDKKWYEFMCMGFFLCKVNLVCYIMFGYINFDFILEWLGKYKFGKFCFYFNELVDVDMDVFEEFICVGLDDMEKKYLL